MRDIATTVGSIMSRHVVTVNLDATVREIRDIFGRYRFHHVIVTERGRAAGIISDRDLLKTISPFLGKMAERPQDVASLTRKAHQVMTRTLVSATEDMPIANAAMVLLNQRVSCLPILDDGGRCVGIVTWRDMLRWTIKQGVACGEDKKARNAA